MLFGILEATLLIAFGGIPHEPATAAAVEIVLLLAGASIPLLLLLLAFYSAFVGTSATSKTMSRGCVCA